MIIREQDNEIRYKQQVINERVYEELRLWADKSSSKKKKKKQIKKRNNRLAFKLTYNRTLPKAKKIITNN